MNMIRSSGDTRGQVVLVAATVVAIALLTMVFAYTQLGSISFDTADEASSRIDTGGTIVNPGSPVIALDTVHNQLTASVQAAVFDDRKKHNWNERQRVIERVRTDVTEDFHRIELYHIQEGRSLTLNFAASHAHERAHMQCPGGPNRMFGQCQSVNGIIIQSRAEEVTIVAIAVEVQVISPTETTNATFMITVE
ncbi:DUF7261 family protein [Haloquadratum walsbyi]|jgi:hypothetical protein|nr:hypothetical protein [Haloquadratum walsbyi]